MIATACRTSLSFLVRAFFLSSPAHSVAAIAPDVSMSNLDCFLDDADIAWPCHTYAIQRFPYHYLSSERSNRLWARVGACLHSLSVRILNKTDLGPSQNERNRARLVALRTLGERQSRGKETHTFVRPSTFFSFNSVPTNQSQRSITYFAFFRFVDDNSFEETIKLLELERAKER
jgi:hypothetical protein